MNKKTCSFLLVAAGWAALGSAMAQVFVQQGSKLVGNGAAGNAFQGRSVALSANGNTALVGGDNDANGVGAVWVWTRSGAVWTQQGSKLVGAGALGAAHQGFSVALSADGNTALVGGPFDHPYNPGGFPLRITSVGAAWVWVRDGSTWTQQAKLVGNDAIASIRQGWSVGLSADGNTALVGAVGAAWVWTRNGSSWIQQGPPLLSPGAIGTVSLSADANTALVGGDGASVWTRQGSTWSQQGSNLVGTGGTSLAGQGSSVALSAHGDTALVGGPTDGWNGYGGPATGAVWAWTRSGATWTPQGAKLVGTGSAGDASQGSAVALSGDGNTAIESGRLDNGTVGAVWVWTRSGGTWTQQGSKLIGTGEVGGAVLGNSVALSSDATTAILGGDYDNNGVGAAWVFVAGPENRNPIQQILLYDPASGQEYTALNNGNGAYRYVSNLFTPAFDTLRTGDFNGDNKADLVVYNSHTALAYIGMGNGDGTFAFQSLFWSPGYNFVEPGDLNGDGKTDFALYNSSTGTMYTGISNGLGEFTYKYMLISTGYTYLHLADFNGDGKADLFAYSAVNGNAAVGIGDGLGGFTFHSFQISPNYNLIDVGDLNGDGKADLILYNAANGNAATGFSDGAGGFAFTSMQFTPGFTALRLADFTGDGKADAVVYNKNNALAYFRTGTGTGTFNFQSLFWSPGYNWVEPKDVNGDGKVDIVLYNSLDGTEYTGISNGNGTFTYTYQYWGIGRVLAR